MQELILHDDEDVDQTNELHIFMEKAITAGAVLSWEGASTNSILLYVELYVGDKIVTHGNGSFSVTRKEKKSDGA